MGRITLFVMGTKHEKVNAVANFDAAIDFVLAHEGGLVDHPNDPGGITNFGVSLRALIDLGDMDFDLDRDGDLDAHDIRAFDVASATDFYRRHFWLSAYDQINSQSVATKLFDAAVNMGPRQAGKILQRALNDYCTFSPDDWPGALTIDGVVGQKTINRINALNGGRVTSFFVCALAKFYYDLVDAKPSRGVFLLGWLRRAYHKPEGE